MMVSRATTPRWPIISDNGVGRLRRKPSPRRPRFDRSWHRRARPEAKQAEEVGRIDEDLARVREAGLAAELAPDRRRLGEVAAGDVLPDLVPFGRRQRLPQGFVRTREALEKRGAIFIVSARRLVAQKDAAGAGGAADRLHQPQLVVAREVMDRQAAPRGVGMFGPAHHGVDEIAMVEIDLERGARETGGGELERRLREID